MHNADKLGEEYIYHLPCRRFLPKVCAESEVDEQFEGRVGNEADVGRSEDVIGHGEEKDVAGADEEREEAGRVEEGVDAQDDARVADLEVLSAGIKLELNHGTFDIFLLDISRFFCTEIFTNFLELPVQFRQ